MAERPAVALPDRAEALRWVGSVLDDAGGAPVGRVAGVYADADSGTPVWLAVALETRRRRLPFGRRPTKEVVVPLYECAAMPGRVWTAQGGKAIAEAPTVDSSRPLLREHEQTICLHYGIGERIGRHAEVSRRGAGSVTALPA